MVFAGVHHLLISNIWETVVFMAIAGALAGVSLIWSYRRLPGRPSVPRWLQYNAAFVGLFALLPVISIALFDPVITFAEAANSDGPLDALIVQALPMTVLATLGIAAILSWRFGSLRRDFGPVLVATTVLMLFLGLNLTIVGLVEFTGAMVRVLVGFIGLILGIGLVFALSVLALEWRRLRDA